MKEREDKRDVNRQDGDGGAFSVNPIVLFADLKDMAAMFWYVLRGRYPLPKRSLIWALIGAGYFVLPIDALPEIIFSFLGFTDDILVLIYVINKMRPDIEKFRVFRKQEDKKKVKYEKDN